MNILFFTFGCTCWTNKVNFGCSASFTTPPVVNIAFKPVFPVIIILELLLSLYFYYIPQVTASLTRYL